METIKVFAPFAIALVLGVAGIGITIMLLGETLLALVIMASIVAVIYGVLKLYVRWYANQ